ncbi:hypothetical protein MVEN_02471600 [Mycena venus]|uniref:Uncharacterized protein n=1 Tax=Mycena venus TaxID=2733690 RepID=A0A8H6WX82_9AGAR|nr:hypothetical protein MVEN_02471600 [Mycena venus]
MKIQISLAVFFLGSVVSANLGFSSRNDQLLPSSVERSEVLEKKEIVERNADRFRRGLPPLPPTRRTSGYRPKPRPSERPCVPLSSTWGRIEVTKADGSVAGYIRKEFDPQHAYTLTTSMSSALQVNLPSTSPFDGPFNIITTNGQDNGHPYLGAVGGGKGYHLGHGQRGSAYLAGTGASPANSPPSSGAGTSMQSIIYNAPGESQIWSMACETREISAQWTNSDFSQPATIIFYDTVEKYLGLTSDLEAFNVGPQDAHAVTFTFVPM